MSVILFDDEPYVSGYLRKPIKYPTEQDAAIALRTCGGCEWWNAGVCRAHQLWREGTRTACEDFEPELPG